MQLRKLTVRNVRVVADAELVLDADLVIFTGANGSGKTSLLEAIHLLGTARSFRARSVQDVVARGSDALLVRGEFCQHGAAATSVGVEKQRGGATALRVSGAEVRAASELARHLPLVTITPDSQRLLSDGAEARRRLLDWLLFHVEPGYHAVHTRYRRVLAQRNAALRAGTAASAQRDAWSSELASVAATLDALRGGALERMLQDLEAAVSALCALPVTLEYVPGWDIGQDLRAALLHGWDRDVARGFTTVGPHRADLRVKVHGRPAQHVVSRGEGKILMAALLAGFARVLAERVARRPLLLVDELASELDAHNRRGFSSVLRQLGMQTFVTAVSEELVDTSGWGRVAVFRMERGQVLQMLE